MYYYNILYYEYSLFCFLLMYHCLYVNVSLFILDTELFDSSLVSEVVGFEFALFSSSLEFSSLLICSEVSDSLVVDSSIIDSFTEDASSISLELLFSSLEGSIFKFSNKVSVLILVSEFLLTLVSHRNFSCTS